MTISQITAKQQARIDAFHERILDAKYGHTKASYEIKVFEVNQLDDCPLVFLTIETGRIGDEGTMASCLCRDRRLIAIGVNGGCRLLNPKRKGKTINKGMWHCLHNLAD